ncbi:MAG: GPW/gp25 family protein [Gammaproteobacteria bacterium]
MAETLPFLGTGWAFPPAFTEGGADVATVTGVEDVHQSLDILLSTRPGERLMQEAFGCDLSAFLFEEIDRTLLNRLSETITTALLRYEPRIRPDRVDIDESGSESGLLLISIEYTIRATNSRFNRVYPFYINEAVRLR